MLFEMSDLGVYLLDRLDQGIGETGAQIEARVVALRTQSVELALERCWYSDRNGSGRFGFLLENLHGRCSTFKRRFCLQFVNIYVGSRVTGAPGKDRGR